MKRTVIAFFLAGWFVSFSYGQEKGFGVGTLFGEPTGISGKYWLSQPNAIDGGLAWSFSGKGFFHIHADFLWHFQDVVKSKERFVVFAGIGGRMSFADPVLFGARFPVGLEWWSSDIPLDVFVEIAPILDLSPATDFNLNGGIGVRYFFE